MRLWTFWLASSSVLAFAFASPTPSIERRDAPYEQVSDHPVWSHQNEDKDQPDKYFHEASFSGHYDGRFADKPLIYDERREHLVALMQTYLATMDDIGAETWIMHGTLLGYYWNKRILPWDSDLDVMMTEKSMHHLANFYNMTVHHYKLPGLDVGRNYMLEVNPHFRNPGLDKVNKIDARWIDMTTGLFIDITTLHRNRTAEVLGEDGFMTVKDKHHYKYDDIFPLRGDMFEGFPVRIPFAYLDLLVEEYGEKAHADVYYLNHRFDTVRQEWMPLTVVERAAFAKYGPQLSSLYWHSDWDEGPD